MIWFLDWFLCSHIAPSLFHRTVVCKPHITSLLGSSNNMTNSCLFCVLVGWFYQRGRAIWTGTPPRLTEQPIIQIQCLATATTRRVTEGNHLPTRTFGDTLKCQMCNCLLFSQADEARGAQKVPCEFLSTSKQGMQNALIQCKRIRE